MEEIKHKFQVGDKVVPKCRYWSRWPNSRSRVITSLHEDRVIPIYIYAVGYSGSNLSDEFNISISDEFNISIKEMDEHFEFDPEYLAEKLRRIIGYEA